MNSQALRPYLSIFGARFRTLLQYRVAAIAGFGTQLFWGLIRVMIFYGFYQSSRRPQPMSYPQVVTYVWLGQALFALLPLGADPDVRGMIREGAVVYEIARPLDLYWLWFTRAVAARTAPTLLRAVPMTLVAIPCLGMGLPPSAASLAGFLLALAGAVMVVSAFATLITISLLWTVSAEGVSRAAPLLSYTFSGMLIPLAFFPGWIRPLVNGLPFRDMIDVPFRLYMGALPAAQSLYWFAHQMLWTVALIVIGRLAVASGTRRMVVQGG